MISFFMLFFSSLIYIYFMNFFSYLNSLLILESLSLFLFFLFLYFMYLEFSFKLLLMYLVFVVSESSLGLSVLVKSVKFYGSNSFNSLTLSMF